MGQKAGTYTLVHKIFLPKKFDKYQNMMLVYGPVTNAVANLGSFFFFFILAHDNWQGVYISFTIMSQARVHLGFLYTPQFHPSQSGAAKNISTYKWYYYTETASFLADIATPFAHLPNGNGQLCTTASPSSHPINEKVSVSTSKLNIK
jgi:hypothetical protein